MGGKSNRNEGVRMIAQFCDRAVPLTEAAGAEPLPRTGESANEGVRMLATFAEVARPIGGDEPGRPVWPSGPAAPLPGGHPSRMSRDVIRVAAAHTLAVGFATGLGWLVGGPLAAVLGASVTAAAASVLSSRKRDRLTP